MSTIYPHFYAAANMSERAAARHFGLKGSSEGLFVELP